MPLLLVLLLASGAAAPTWKQLRPGVEYALVADGLHAVRIDPRRAPLQAVMASAGDCKQRTAGQWCRDRKLAVAINLGMYRDDKLTNVGHAHAPGHINNARWSSKYKTALAFGSKQPGAPDALMMDIDAAGAMDRLGAYGTVVQNLRLIRAPGVGVWGKQDRRWSEAAVAADGSGRVLFLSRGVRIRCRS